MRYRETWSYVYAIKLSTALNASDRRIAIYYFNIFYCILIKLASLNFIPKVIISALVIILSFSLVFLLREGLNIYFCKSNLTYFPVLNLLFILSALISKYTFRYFYIIYMLALFFTFVNNLFLSSYSNKDSSQKLINIREKIIFRITLL